MSECATVMPGMVSDFLYAVPLRGCMHHEMTFCGCSPYDRDTKGTCEQIGLRLMHASDWNPTGVERIGKTRLSSCCARRARHRMQHYVHFKNDWTGASPRARLCAFPTAC